MNAIRQIVDDTRAWPRASTSWYIIRALLGRRGPYLDGEVPADPWGRAFEFHLENLQPEIVSYGADGKPGGEFFDMDLSSRNNVGCIDAKRC